MSRRAKLILVVVVVLLLVLTQLQPVFLRSIGAVDGSFGLRPVSHRCAGIRLSGEWIAVHLAPADWQATLGYFSIRYHIPNEATGREFCLGQDIWFGE
jgi:hypothetical protein